MFKNTFQSGFLSILYSLGYVFFFLSVSFYDILKFLFLGIFICSFLYIFFFAYLQEQTSANLG